MQRAALGMALVGLTSCFADPPAVGDPASSDDSTGGTSAATSTPASTSTSASTSSSETRASETTVDPSNSGSTGSTGDSTLGGTSSGSTGPVDDSVGATGPARDLLFSFYENACDDVVWIPDYVTCSNPATVIPHAQFNVSGMMYERVIEVRSGPESGFSAESPAVEAEGPRELLGSLGCLQGAEFAGATWQITHFNPADSPSVLAMGAFDCPGDAIHIDVDLTPVPAGNAIAINVAFEQPPPAGNDGVGLINPEVFGMLP